MSCDITWRPCRLRVVGVGAALRTPTRLQSLGPACETLVPVPGSAGSGEIRSLAWDPSSLASRRSGGLPESPSAPPLRCPDAVTPRAVPLANRSQPRPLTRPGGRSVASRRARVRCLGPKTGWRPAGPPLATVRFRRVTFHPYKGEEGLLTVALRPEEKTGSLWRGACWPYCATPADAFRIGSG